MRTAPQPSLFFKGRPGDPRLGEQVQSIDPATAIGSKLQSQDVAILGSPDDQGVTRNLGRPGAALGPDEIRKHLYKFAAFKQTLNRRIFDVGNSKVEPEILSTHRHAHQLTLEAASTGCTVVSMGGGHDFAASHILGWCEGQPKNTVCGLINIDPHLDVRPWPDDRKPHSGTPFRQILESQKILGTHLTQFGARRGRNAAEHFEFCNQHGVQIQTLEDLIDPYGLGNVVEQFKNELNRLAASVDAIAVTFDMDSCQDINGVSAATTIGFTARELYQMAVIAGREPKVTLLDIAEVAPTLDPTERSQKLAAELIYAFLQQRVHGA